jgi:phosphotransferase system IIA component
MYGDGGAIDALTGSVTAPANGAITVVFLLNDDTVTALRIAI